MTTPHTETGASEMANTRFAKDQLKAFVERIERLEEEKKAIADDIRDVYAEAKGNGFDTKALRAIITLRKQEPTERNEHQLILETYMNALGMLPGFERDDPPRGGGSGGTTTNSNGSGHGSSSAPEKLLRPKAEQAASTSRGGDRSNDHPDVSGRSRKAEPGTPPGETPGPRETNPELAVPAGEAGARTFSFAAAGHALPPVLPEQNTELRLVVEDGSAAGGQGTPQPAPALPLASWRAPTLFEVDPATELPTFMLRGHRDCAAGRATGPPEVRPP